MKDLIDFINSLIESSKSRLKNPWIGSFAISFVIFNWRPIVYFLRSDASIEQRLEHYVLYMNEEFGWWLWFGVPFLFSLFYTIGMPYVLAGLGKLLRNANNMGMVNASNKKVDEIETSTEVVKAEINLEKKKTDLINAASVNSEINKLNTLVNSLHQDKINLDEQIIHLTQEKNLLTGESLENKNIISGLRQENKKLVQESKLRNKSFPKIFFDLSEEEQQVFSILNEKGMFQEFFDYSKQLIIVDQGFELTNSVKDFISLGLISTVKIGERVFTLTRMGINLHFYIKNSDLAK